MNLQVGILGNAGGWKLLLQQIGVPHAVVKGKIDPDKYSAVVVSGDVSGKESESLRQYLGNGGGVLCPIKVYSKIRNFKVSSKKTDFFFDRDPIFSSADIIDVAVRCCFPRKSTGMEVSDGKLIACEKVDKGYVVALPFNADELARDNRTAVKSFYSPERRLPFERVSLVSKGGIRTLVSDCLEILHHRRRLPYVHFWYYPYGKPSVSCFRIDTDYGVEKQVEGLYRTINENRIPATWFVDVKSQEKLLAFYSKMRRQEIGVHCYEHRTYPDYERNLKNIRKAKAALRTKKIKAEGFASPFGIWNKELGRAILDSGFVYSSEFSYDYDNVPGAPQLNNSDGVLQIPVHPICIGSLKRHGYSDRQMISYFTDVIQRKLAFQEPVIFYHHPRDEHLHVVDWLLKELKSQNVPVHTMGEYAKWWKKRILAVSGLRYTKGNIYRNGIKSDKSLYIHITQSNGTQAIIPAAKKIVMKKVKWYRKSSGWNMPDDYIRMRRFNYRIPLIYSLDAVTGFLKSGNKE